MPKELTEDEQHKRNVAALVKEYGGKISPEEIEDIYHKRLSSYLSAKVRKLLPVIIQREVKELLSAQCKCG